MKQQLSRTSNNPSTTVRHYSLFALASEALTKAQQAKRLAYLAAESNPTRANIRAFMDADKAVETAEENLRQVKLMQKYVKGTVQA